MTKNINQRLSHALALGNSPADMAAVAGHRTEQLLNTYAKPTGRVVMPNWIDYID